MGKFFKTPHIIPIVLITTFTFFVWRRALNQALIGEGAIYLTEPYVSMLSRGGFLAIANRHDVFPFLFIKFLGEHVFRDSMWMYYLFLLSVAGIINCLLYYLVSYVTKQKTAGLVAVIFFTANYVSSFQKLGQGYYQWFIQRVPNFIPGILGLIFLIKFYERKKHIFYWLSLGNYLLAFFLGHYTLIILPVFVIYPFAHVFVNNKKDWKRYFLAFFQALPFMLGSYFLLKGQDLNSSQIAFSSQLNSEIGIVYFLQKQPWLKELLKEITIMIVPINPAFNITLANLYSFSIPICFGLLALFLLVYRKVGNFVRPLLLSSAIALLAATLTVLYLNPGAVFFHRDTLRYLYVPSMVFAIFLGIAVGWVLEQRVRIKITVIIIVAMWTLANIQMINRGFDFWQPAHNITLATVEYLRNNHSDFPQKSIVVTAPMVSSYTVGMLDHFYFESAKNKLVYSGGGIKLVHYDANLVKRLKVYKEQYNSIVFLRYKDKKIEPVVKDMEEIIGDFDAASLFKK